MSIFHNFLSFNEMKLSEIIITSVGNEKASLAAALIIYIS